MSPEHSSDTVFTCNKIAGLEIAHFSIVPPRWGFFNLLFATQGVALGYYLSGLQPFEFAFACFPPSSNFGAAGAWFAVHLI